jgi:hypothetical protein
MPEAAALEERKGDNGDNGERIEGAAAVVVLIVSKGCLR